MASGSIDELAELSCSLCSQLYSSPRVLPCLHSFCEACLEGHQENICGEGEELTCPIDFCQRSAGKELGKLPTNVWVEGKISVETNIRDILKGKCSICDSSNSDTFCTDCSIALCGDCTTNWHNKNKLYKTHSLVPVVADSVKTALADHFAQSVKQKRYCSKHDKREAECRCHDCEEDCCFLCCLFGSCKDHDYECIADIAKDSRSNLNNSVESLVTPAETLATLLAECKETINRLNAREKECEERIEAEVGERMAALMKQKKELLTQCHTIAQSKRTCLGLQMENIQRMIQQIEYSCTVVSQACSDYTDTELLAVSDEMVQRLDILNVEFSEEKMYPCTTDTIVNTFQAEYQLGEVVEGCYPPNCVLELRVKPITCFVKKRTWLRLVTQNEDGELYTRGGDTIEAILEGEPVTIHDNEDGTYDLVIRTTSTADDYQLSVKIHGIHIMGSPFRVRSKSTPSSRLKSRSSLS